MKVKIDILLLLFLLISFSIGSTASKPDWVDNNGISTQFPEDDFITGFGFSENNNTTDRIRLAEQNAFSDLSSRFLVRIQSELTTIQRETSETSFSDVSNTISVSTQLTLLGAEIYHWDDAKNKQAYALAVMEINKAFSQYSSHIDDLESQIDTLISLAEKAEKNGDLKSALMYYRKALPLYAEYGETRLIINMLRGEKPFSSSAFKNEKLKYTISEIEGKIYKNITENITSLKSAAVSIVEQIHEQAPERIPVKNYPLTYHDSDFPSEFSGVLMRLLETELTSYFNVIDANSTTFAYLLTGTYWLDNEKVHVYISLADPANGKKSAAAIVTFLRIFPENEGVALLPQNFEQAMEDSRIFLKQDVIPGSLSLDVWTSKGDKNLIFKQHEETDIFVRVNKPCYLQVLYHMANGERLLLYNNMYIDVSKVNQVVTLPDRFYFAPPLGVERLQVFASTEKHSELKKVKAQFGSEEYENVLTKDFIEHTINIRGIKKKYPEKQIAEKILTITTIKNGY